MKGDFFGDFIFNNVCVCVCNDLNQAAMPASPGIPSLSTRALLARVQR